MPRLELSGRAVRDLRVLPLGQRARLRAALDSIRADPEGGKRLRGEFAGLRSWRVGSYRIIYEFSQDVIEVVSVGHRSAIHRQP